MTLAKFKLNLAQKGSLSANLVCLLFIFLFVFSCRKYPEGDRIRKAKNNLLGFDIVNQRYDGKNWKLHLYEVNGIDSTVYIYMGNSYTKFQNEMIRFQQADYGHDNYSMINPVYVAKSDCHSYYIKFLEKKSKLSFSFGSKMQCPNNACERNIFNPEFVSPGADESEKRTEWTIIKLTENEFTLTYNGRRNYKITLIYN